MTSVDRHRNRYVCDSELVVVSIITHWDYSLVDHFFFCQAV